jgi:hypothetical protein
MFFNVSSGLIFFLIPILIYPFICLRNYFKGWGCSLKEEYMLITVYEAPSLISSTGGWMDGINEGRKGGRE